MLEGGGKTPILTPLELEDIGYKIVAYPLSLIGVSIRAMQVTCPPFLLCVDDKFMIEMRHANLYTRCLSIVFFVFTCSQA
jgi:hypothetical protein